MTDERPKSASPPPWSPESIRTRPEMYIGMLDDSGLTQILEIVLSNAVEECFYGNATQIQVVRHHDGSLSVVDDGRGIPDGIEPASGMPRFTLALTRGPDGEIRSDDEPRLASAMRSSHLISANALSEWMEVVSRRAGRQQSQRFEKGLPATELQETKISSAGRTGTMVRWKPDGSILGQTLYRPDAIRSRLRTLSYLVPGLRCSLHDELTKTSVEYSAPEGLAGFVESLNTGRTTLHAPVCASREQDGFRVDFAYQYRRDDQIQILGYLNHHLTIEGGSHLRAVRMAVSDTVTSAAREAGKLSSPDQHVDFEKAAAGLTAVVSLRHPRPKLEGAVRGNMGHPELVPLFRELMAGSLAAELVRSPQLLQRLFWRW